MPLKTDWLFAWSDEEREVFPYLGEAATAWAAWIASNTPGDAQLARKMLLDMWPHYRAAVHQGAEMAVTETAAGRAYRARTGEDITSTADYVHLIQPLIAFLRATRRSDSELAGALVRFVVSGTV